MAKERMKKLTILVPEDLLRRARKATKGGATPTVRKGLELLAAQDVYDRLLALEGKVKFSLTWQEMRGEE
jgi:Fe2+ or Zn2+ uptake regulation protein